MKLILAKPHVTTLVVTSVKVLVTGDVNSQLSNFRLTFIADARADIAYDENGSPVLDENGKVTYTITPTNGPVVVDSVNKEGLPFDLYSGLRKASTQIELLEMINPMLQQFNSEFTGTLAGLDMQVELVEF